MTSVIQDYRQFLRDSLEARCQKNARYSLRSFARDLGLSAPRLSRVLNGHHGLSAQAAKDVAARLNLSPAERELFCTLVESEHARAAVTRASAKQRANELAVAFQSLGADSFRVISDWYHLAILELTLVEGFRSSPAWIANQLGITPIEAKAAIERLTRMELLEKQGSTLRATGSNFINPQGLPSDAVRKFHSQILGRAQQALELQTVEEREFASLVLAIDEAALPRIRGHIREFTRRVNAESEAVQKKTRVYNLSVQFFGLQIKEK